jgi:glycolate oxidase iron-sulfur subunit
LSVLDLTSGQPYVDDCVHCGFCLDSCPTYVLWAQEADSPRGRIVQIGDAIEAGGTVSVSMTEHIDTCLGCLACVTACPSGVQYDKLIARARPAVERQAHRSNTERALRLLLFETLPYPKRLRALAPALRASKRLHADRLPERISLLAKVAPDPPSKEQLRRPIPPRTPAVGVQRGRVGLLLGCVQRVFFSDVHHATIAVLAAEGYEVLAPPLPDCCGALELHSGEVEHGFARAQATMASFAALGELDAVITNSAGCGSAMKEYGELLGTPEAHAFAEQVYDITEFLASIEPRAVRGPVPLKVVYHDACHLRHAQGIRAEPRTLLSEIPSLELLEVVAEPDVCCGSAGVFNVLQPVAAAELGARKAGNLLATGAEAIAAANPGCAAQIVRHTRDQGHPLPVVHPVELVWRSIQAASAARP